MALDDILTSMDGARDALVTAINAKGGSLADNTTLYQCAETVGSLSGGTSAEYYKCASVDTGGTVTDGKTLTVSGAMWGSYYNGTYTLQNESATGYERVWIHSGGRYALKYYTGISYIGNTNGGWGFFDLTYPNMDPDYLCEYDDANPWEHTLYQNAENGEEDNINIVPSTTAVPGNTWSGYKAVFDSTAGTWRFESDVTAGLTYTGLTPVVNKIYTADTTIQLAYIKLAGILNDETVKFLLYPKSSGTLEDISAGGNGVTVANTGGVAIDNGRIVFGEGKALTIPANTLPDDIFVSGSPFIIEFQGIIPAYTSKTCGAFARKEGSMYYDRLDMYLNTIQGDANYGQMTIGYWTNNVTVPVGAFTVGAEHVVAFEYDGSNTSRVYLDGVMQYSFTGTSYLPFRTYDFLIGHDTDEIGGSNANPFQGNMSYFRLRNVAPYQGASYTPEFV